MTKMQYAILILTLVLAASSKVHHSQTTLQEQNIAYYDALMAKENDLKARLAQIESAIAMLNTTLSQVQNNTSIQIIALEDTMADERYLLDELQQTHVLPLSLKSVNCTNITQQDLSQIQISIQQIQGDLNDLNNTINQLEANITTPDNYTSTCIQNLRLQRDWAENYLKTLQQQLLVQCPTPLPAANLTSNIGIANVTAYQNISNLNNSNWIYGNTTQSQYYLNLFQLITSNNVTNCPASAPFVLAGTTNCSNCYDPTPLFDVSTSKCVACPSHSVYDANQRQCITNVTCPQGATYNSAANTCVCASVNPFYNGTVCVSCYLPNYWNKTSLSCMSCPKGSIYRVDLEKC